MGAVSGAKCGMCMASLGVISISCNGCNSRYYPTHVCLGLLDNIFNTIKEYHGRGMNFWCTSVKLDGGSRSNGPESCSIVVGSRGLDDGFSEKAVKQLFEAVKSLCAAVATLANNMKQMIETWSVKC